MNFACFNIWTAQPVGRGYFICDGYLVKTSGGVVKAVTSRCFPV